MTDEHPRIMASAAAFPKFDVAQDQARDALCALTFGPEWAERSDVADGVERMARLFAATEVHNRQFVVELSQYYSEPRGIEDRMRAYESCSYPLAREALVGSLESLNKGGAASVSDFILVSCTGYVAPGLDVLLARDLGMRPSMRRVSIGHMGCYGALVGLREALVTLRARQSAVVALLSIELCSLHWFPTTDIAAITSFGLFGDASAMVMLTSDPNASGPQLVDAYCVSDFSAMEQMSWRIKDDGFMMGLSPRVPVTLGRNVEAAMTELLSPHSLQASDVAHWIVHPGGPSILQSIQRKLKLTDEQMEPAWHMLRDHGNCSSATVLVMLDQLLRSGTPKPGEWGVMMAFGPGLTLETCLLRF